MIYLGTVMLTWTCKLIVELFARAVFGKVMNSSLFISYISPTILFAAVALLILFSKLQVTSILNRFIMFFGPLSFGVYLIHTHPLVWKWVMEEGFSDYAKCHPILLVLDVLGTVFGIWFFCSLIDFVRLKLFETLKVNLLVENIVRHIGAFMSNVLEQLDGKRKDI